MKLMKRMSIRYITKKKDVNDDAKLRFFENESSKDDRDAE